MRRILLAIAAAAAMVLAAPSAAWAGNPHFVSADYSVSDGTVTVSGKIAGLGNEDQVEVKVDVTAQCVNKGNNKPKAANKASATAVGTFPVQNGKADFSLSVTPTFKPKCSPPMTVEITSITVEDVTHGLKLTLL